jgi:hypothetical protein
MCETGFIAVNMLLLAVQAAKEKLSLLGTLHDLHVLIERYPTAAESALKMSGQLGMSRLCDLVFKSAQSLFSTGLPPAYSETHIILLSHGTIICRLKALLLRYILPSGSDWETFNFPRLLFPLYFIVKPLRSLLNFSRQLIAGYGSNRTV